MSRTFKAAITTVLAVVAVVVISATPARAQGSAEGVIAGTVADASGAVLPGVTITATSTATGASRTHVTEGNGRYRLAALSPGTYEVAVELAGFATVKRSLTVTVGANIDYDVVLALKSVEESVVVTGEAPLVETAKTQQSVTVAESEVRNLPTNERNFLEFALLAPGVTRGRSSGAGWGGDQGFSASGNRGDQNSINIDGLQNRDGEGVEVGNFSQEAVQEFQVITQSYPAEYGGAAGGVVNAVTKSGTNKFRGYVFDYIRSNALAKSPFTLPRVDLTNLKAIEASAATDADEFRQDNFGYSIGGPLLKDRMFFYSVLEMMRSNTPRVRTIPQDVLEAVRTIAIPNLPDDESNNVTQFKPTSRKFSLKIDNTFTQQHNASFRVSSARNFTPSGSAAGNNSLLGYSESEATYLMTSAAVNSFLTDHLLNNARFQFNRIRDKADWPFMGGLSNIANFPPHITVGPYSFGRTNGGGQPYTDENKWEWQDTLTWAKGDHEIKLGADVMINQYWLDFQRGQDGEMFFSDLNAFHAGRPSNYIQVWGPSAAYVLSKYYSGFAQDQWYVREGLTVNFGLRYDLAIHPTYTTWKVEEGTVNASTGETYETGSLPADVPGFKNPKKDFAPRLGLTYTPDNGTTLIRAGGGIFYGVQYLGELANSLCMSGYPMQLGYVFGSNDATAIWAGSQDPLSPYYNETGARRLPHYYGALFQSQGQPYSSIRFDTNLKTPKSYQANIGIDREITSAIAVSAQFLWSKGLYNIRNRDTNPAAPVFYTAGSALPTAGGLIAPYDLNVFQGPRPNPGFGLLQTYVNTGRISYKGASVGLTVRKGGLNSRVSYTFSDTWDDSAAITIRQGPSDLTVGEAGEWSPSVQATRHRLAISTVYVMPGHLPVYARDWQFATIINLESGHPFQVYSGFDFNNDAVNTDRPLGVPRNALWTDPIYNVDARIGRTVPIKGNFRVEVLFDMFNLFNTPHYDNYNANLYVRVGGRYVPAVDFAAFAGSPALNQRDLERTPQDIGLNTAARRTRVGAPFQGQLAIRLHF
jgi:hypothetical protein